MCIIADVIIKCFNTNIICWHIGYKYDNNTITPSQLVVFKTNIDSSGGHNAIILPIFNPGNDPSKIIPLKLSELTNIFNSVDTLYNKWYPNNKFVDSKYQDSSQLSSISDNNITIIPHKSFFETYNMFHFNISKDAKETINAHNDNYSFIVYPFNGVGNINITPFGYLAPAYDNSLYIPTIQCYPHNEFADLGTGYVPNMYINFGVNAFDDKIIYDHVIYSLIKTCDTNSSINHTDVKYINNILNKIVSDINGKNIKIYIPKFGIHKKNILNGININRNLLVTSEKTDFINDLIDNHIYFR